MRVNAKLTADPVGKGTEGKKSEFFAAPLFLDDFAWIEFCQSIILKLQGKKFSEKLSTGNFQYFFPLKKIVIKF